MKMSKFKNRFIQNVTGMHGEGPHVLLVVTREWTYLYDIDATFISKHSMKYEHGTNMGDFGLCLS